MLAEPEPLPELLLALIEAEMLSLKLVLVETDSLVLIEALTLLLMLAEVLAEVEASPEPLLVLVEPEPLPELLLALIDAEVLSLNDTLTDLLSETDSLALTDSR
ncbi:hypothetical protein SORDD05_00995 [Streptococcus oralis]|uniref:Uncharacterized protein n=1 Tax=Streptococcus oralis TaxID=1303 RepID=A0A139M9C6_STROR|nr:hypothetical protein SORDD05_00995 [Streptococcus oralis]